MTLTPGEWLWRRDHGQVGSVELADGTVILQAQAVTPTRRGGKQVDERNTNAEFAALACSSYKRHFADPLQAAREDQLALLLKSIREKDDEIARLQKIVDELPKTADEVPITPGSQVWSERSDSPISIHMYGMLQLSLPQEVRYFGDKWSTWEKAMEAREKRQ